MSSLNRVELIGNLTANPENKAKTGSSVVRFSIATNSSYKKQDGTKVDEVEFHNCTAFGKLGEIIVKYLSKGSSIYVSGKLKTSKWTTDDGQKRSSTGIIVNEMQMLGSKNSVSEAPKQDEASGDEKIDVDSLPF